MKLRLERYIESLSQEESDAVARAVAQQNRPGLMVLWQECCRMLSEGKSLKEQKEALYRSLFGEEYRKDQDYRLRNEYRQLVRLIERVLVERYAIKKLQRSEQFTNMLLLEVLTERQLWAEFDDVLAEALAKATAEHDYLQAVQLCQAAVNATLRKGMYSQERLFETLSWIDRAIGALLDYVVTEYEHAAALRTATEHMLDAEHLTYPPLPPLDLDRTTTLQQYYHLKRLAVRYTGTERLEAAKQCAALISSIATDPGTLLFAERISAMGTLGVLLMTVGLDYRASAEASHQALLLALQHGDSTIIPLLGYNYCSALMKAEAYKDVLTFLAEHPELFEDERVGFRFALLRTYAYVFLSDVDSAQQVLPVASRRYPVGEYHYAWFLYAIIAYMRGDINDALREIGNLRKHFNRQKLKATLPTEYALVGIYSEFFSAMGFDTSRRRIAARQRIEARIEQLCAAAPQYHDYLPLVWLRKNLVSLT
jgi:hypothetical protein